MKKFFVGVFSGNFSVKFPCFPRLTDKRSTAGSKPKGPAIMPPRHPLPDYTRIPARISGHARQTTPAAGPPDDPPGTSSTRPPKRSRQSRPGKAGNFPRWQQITQAGQARKPYAHTPTRQQANATPAQAYKRHTRPPHPTAGRHQAGPATHTHSHTRASRPTPTPSKTQTPAPRQRPAAGDSTRNAHTPGSIRPRPRPHHARIPPRGDLNAPARRYWRASFKACGFGSSKFL